MKICLAIAILCFSCAAQNAQSAFEKEHLAGVEQNPPGIELRIAAVDGRSTYHASDRIQIELSFTSNVARTYTVETIVGMSDAGGSDDVVVQLPGMDTTWHSLKSMTQGLICCDSRRHYVTRAARSAIPVSISLKPIQAFIQKVSQPALGSDSQRDGKTSYEYSLFVQSGRVMQGWPKSEKEKYHGRSSFLVTSSNVLYFTILPDKPGDPRQ